MSKMSNSLIDVPVNDTDYDYIMATEEKIDHAKEMQDELYLDNYQRSEEDYQSEIARF